MKLLQWNIWYKEDVHNIVSTLREVNPDIICLQELTINHPHYNQEINVPQFVADELGFNYYFKEAQRSVTDGKERRYGNGIFSRYPLSDCLFKYIQEPHDPNVQNPDYSEEGRVYVESSIEQEGIVYTIGTTHMSYTDGFKSTTAKETEADNLIAIIENKKSNFILTGDFNSLPDSYPISEVLKLLNNVGPVLEEKTWTTKPFSYNGFSASTLDWRVDYCFASPDIKIKSAQILNTPFSDHLPILIEF